MSYTQTPTARAATGVVMLSSIVMLASALDPDLAAGTLLYRIALAVTILGCTGWVLSNVCATERELERARQEGYDDGLLDRCDLQRQDLRVSSTVVPLDRTAFKSAPGQLGQEVEFGDGGERTG